MLICYSNTVTTYHSNPRIIFCILSVKTQIILYTNVCMLKKCFLSKSMYFNENEKAHIIHMYTVLSSPYSVPPYILTQCLIRLDRLTESQLTMLEIQLGWLQLLIYRGRGLRPLIRKITCNQQKKL
jgi:hypothetical protein